MKNIHILPTSQPSRLYIGDNQNFVFGMIQTSIQSRNDCFTNQHIYITSDKEIKEGDWFYDLDTKYVKVKQSWENSHLGFNGKKIILTTDQRLIKDGVQAIDDEFLEWFVKNPSCEEVEVEAKWFTYMEYKIIIPKEETKQETLEEAVEIFFNKRAKEEGFENWTQIIVQQEWEFIELFPIEFAKWQQETYNQFTLAMDELKSSREGYLKAKLEYELKQQERSYSAEDMREMYNKSCGLIGLGELDDQSENDKRFRELISEFKNK